MHGKSLPLLLIIQLALFTSIFSQTNEQVRANLYAFNTNGTASLNDGNLTMYNINNSNAVDNMDAIKMTNFGENFGLQRGNKTLAIERRQTITTSDTIFFRMWNMHHASYKIDLILTGLAHPDLTASLEDSYLNSSTELNLNGINTYLFNITGDTASWAADRFKIIFATESSSLKVLPVTFTNIKASKTNNNIDVEWSAENEKDVKEYQVEKSIDGQTFSPVATFIVKGKASANYNWTDISNDAKNNFYRVASIDINGKTSYSSVTQVSLNVENELSIYPNPIINGSINIHLKGALKGDYTARIINNYGQVVYITQIKHEGANNIETIQLNHSNNYKGNYILEIITPDNNRLSRKIQMQ